MLIYQLTNQYLFVGWGRNRVFFMAQPIFRGMFVENWLGFSRWLRGNFFCTSPSWLDHGFLMDFWWVSAMFFMFFTLKRLVTWYDLVTFDRLPTSTMVHGDVACSEKLFNLDMPRFIACFSHYQRIGRPWLENPVSFRCENITGFIWGLICWTLIVLWLLICFLLMLDRRAPQPMKGG